MDRKLGILADTSRSDKKVMQGYFEQKHNDQLEAKRLNPSGTERGMNLHLYSAAKFRDGALNLTSEGINKIEGKEKMRKKNHLGASRKQKRKFEDIVKVREDNPEYMTGKKFQKKRGNVGKKFKTGKKNKKHGH